MTAGVHVCRGVPTAMDFKRPIRGGYRIAAIVVDCETGTLYTKKEDDTVLAHVGVEPEAE